MPNSSYQGRNGSYTRSGSGRTTTARRGYSQSAGRSSAGRSSSHGRRRRRRRGNGGRVLLILAVLILIGTGIFLGVRAFRGRQEDRRLALEQEQQQALADAQKQELLSQTTFYPGITVDGVDISGMSYEEAESALSANQQGGGKHILLTDGDGSYTLDVVEGSDVSTVLDKAYALGRTGSEEERLAEIERIAQNPVTFEVTGGYSVLDLDGRLQTLKEQLDTAPVNAKVTGFDTSSKKFKVEKGQMGRALDVEAVKQKVQAALSRASFEEPIQLTFTEVEPEIQSTQVSEAKLMAKFTTTTTNNSNRNNNIKLCSTALSGAVVMPGEEFSVNNTTGKRGEDKGYKEAAVIKNGVYVQEPGGGVCQVSSTLFNAVVRAGLKITERHNHTIKSTYVPESEDAAIDYPGKDFKFRNNSSGPVAVVFTFDTEERKLTAYVYGTPILKDGETLDLESKLISETPQPEPTYQEDPTLAYGEELLVSEGRAGAKYETYLIHLKDGKEVSRELLHTSNYPAKASVYSINSAAVPGEGDFDVPDEGSSGEPAPELPDEGDIGVPEE